MSLVDTNSCICVKSELDIFSVPPTQTSIEDGIVVDYHPIASLVDTGPIEFDIPASVEHYLDRAHVYLHLAVKITKNDGSNLEAGSAVGPTNLFLHSLFSQVDVQLNGKQVSSSSNTYAYRAYLKTLLNYGKPAKESQMTAALWYKDTATKMDTAGADNAGFTKRATFTATSKTVGLFGRIHADLFHQEKLLITGVGMHVKMVRSKTPFALMSNEAGANYKFKIERATLHVRKVKVAHAVALAHAKALEYGNAKYPLQRVECKTFSVPAGGRDVTQEKIFTGQLPTRVVVGCVENDAFNGVFKKNPFNFQNYKITRISLHVDGEEKCPLTCDFETGRIAQAYMSLFSSTEKAFKDEDIDVSREDYVNGYSLFCFDLTPDLGESDHFSLIKSGNVRLAINFAEELARTINVIVYAEFQNVLEVDKNRNVFYDFSV